MPSPTESPPASLAPRLAASITPGPPPVITAYPARARAAPSSSASRHSGLSGMLRAEPKTLTAGGRSARVSKPSTNSDRMRSARQASLVFQSPRPRESSSRWSAVLLGMAPRRSVTAPRCRSRPRSGAGCCRRLLWLMGATVVEPGRPGVRAGEPGK